VRINSLRSGWFAVLTLLCVATRTVATISVSNFSAGQIEGTKQVGISFDVFNSAASEVSVSVLISNGVSQVSATSFTGHIGGHVQTGTNRQILWNGGADLNDMLTSSLSVTLRISDPISPGLVLIPAGSNAGNDPDYGSYSLMVNAFYMDATEITKSEWDQIANTTLDVLASSGDGKGANHPVQNITWYEAVRWCNARSAADGLTPCYNTGSWSCDFTANGYRLPTDVEWEYAARGGNSGLRFPWGNLIDHSNANYYSAQADSYDVSEEEGYHPGYSTGALPYTSPVGSFSPNGYGLYDMAGNVWEWCWDSYGSKKSRRGGSWASEASFLRNGYKDTSYNGALPNIDNYYLGFRTVRNAPEGIPVSVIIPFDSRNYELAVASSYGQPVPPVGIRTYAWRSAVPCSVDAQGVVGGTNYTCIGWAGTGSVPVSGSSNTVLVVLSNLTSSISWNWASDDADLDGMNDDWERDFFGNLSQDENSDHDLDGQRDIEEYIAGTNPTNPASLFELRGTSGPNRFVIDWPAATGRTYNVYWTDNLRYTGFQPLETNMTFPRNSVTTTPSTLRGFYKVDVRK